MTQYSCFCGPFKNVGQAWPFIPTALRCILSLYYWVQVKIVSQLTLMPQPVDMPIRTAKLKYLENAVKSFIGK